MAKGKVSVLVYNIDKVLIMTQTWEILALIILMFLSCHAFCYLLFD